MQSTANGKILPFTKMLRIMKLTSFFILFGLLQVAARSTAQVTLKENAASLEKVLKSIKRQSSYDLFFDQALVHAKGKPVSITLTNVPVEKALEEVFRGQELLTYTVTGRIITVQEKKVNTPGHGNVIGIVAPIDVKGRVVNEKGEPVVATVTVKGAMKATTTDENGYFELKDVDEKATLIISGVNIETYVINVNGRTDLSVLSVKIKVTAIDDVVIKVNTGYQNLTKERATGSFSFIDNKLYNEQTGTNVLNRLQHITNGYVAVTRWNTNSQVPLIRGLSTFSTSLSKPLVILDNFEYQGDINNINPNDVENITVLKDAAAGSIWGAKAANGVIVITTKKGKYNQPLKIELNTNLSVTDKPDLFYSKVISSSDFIDVERMLFSRGFYNSSLSLPQFYVLSPVVNLLDRAKRGIISQAQADAQIDEMRDDDVREQFDRYFYQRATNQQYALNFSGGTKDFSWILSGGFDKSSSVTNEQYDRFTLRFDNSYIPFKNIEITTSIGYTQSNSTRGKTNYADISTISGAIPPYTRFADDAGNPLPVYTLYNSSYIDTLGGGKLLDWRYYPLNDYKYISDKTLLQDINTVIGVKYKISSSLHADIKYRYKRQATENNYLYDQQSYYARDLINTYSQLSSGSVIYKVPKGDILDVSDGNLTAQNLRAQLNFTKTRGRQAIVSLVGMEISQTISKSNAYRSYGYNPEILAYVNVDYANLYPQLVYGSTSFIPNPASFGKTNNRFVSLFMNGAYTYNNKYTVSVSARRDASNIFGQKTNDKWKPFWSTGLNWDIAKESFYHFTFLPYLRLKATYGYQGNIDPSKTAVTTIRYSDISPFTLTPYSVVQNFYNPELKWEQVAMLNTGIEWATKNRRLAGSIEYYEKRMKDLYAATPIESTIGIGSPTLERNIGKMKGHGWDIEINTKNIDRRFKWNTQLIFNNYRDKITKLKNPVGLQGSEAAGSLGFTQLEGYSPFSYFAYRWAGLDPATGDPLGYVNGQASKDYTAITGAGTKFTDLRYVGSQFPRIFGSLGNSFSWKGIDLSVRIVYKFDYYFKRESIDYYSLVNLGAGHSDYAIRWQKPGDEAFTNVPSFVYPIVSRRETFYESSEILATKGDHIRLQYISAGYDLKTIWPRLRCTTFQFYLVANNIGLLWKANKYGIDPDYNNNSIPAARNYSLGLRVSL